MLYSLFHHALDVPDVDPRRPTRRRRDVRVDRRPVKAPRPERL